jgi:hypothetical protein
LPINPPSHANPVTGFTAQAQLKPSRTGASLSRLRRVKIRSLSSTVAKVCISRLYLWPCLNCTMALAW